MRHGEFLPKPVNSLVRLFKNECFLFKNECSQRVLEYKRLASKQRIGDVFCFRSTPVTFQMEKEGRDESALQRARGRGEASPLTWSGL